MQYVFPWRWQHIRTFDCGGTRARICIVWRGGAIDCFREFRLAKIFASVLIDTYNHERFIEKAIVSALEQDFPAADREIIVVDDGSTDRTAEIVRKFEPRVRLLGKENGGQASAFNAGIPECKGEIGAFLDGDDLWASHKLTTV